MTYARPRPRRWALPAALLVTSTALTATPATASDRCRFGAEPYAGRPWPLQRVLLDDLWQRSTGRGVDVAVVDTGVDAVNPQLTDAVDTTRGVNLMDRGLTDDQGRELPRGKENGTTDTAGHGTRVAGIIAARPMEGTGFVGLAPGATIVPVQQNDAAGHGTARTLARAVDHARRLGVGVINISQDTDDAVESPPELYRAVERALDEDIVIVASAGNDGLGGGARTYPASHPGVLAVAASDRDGERAAFSRTGEFVGVAAPGVDVVSTVPGGGHCSASGTSFAAPYVAGVAALLRAHRPGWKQQQIVAQIKQTAQRPGPGPDRLVGWGVVDPVRALAEADRPRGEPVAHERVIRAKAPEVAPLRYGESPRETAHRLATYALAGCAALFAAVTGGAVAVRDARRRRHPDRTR